MKLQTELKLELSGSVIILIFKEGAGNWTTFKIFYFYKIVYIFYFSGTDRAAHQRRAGNNPSLSPQHPRKTSRPWTHEAWDLCRLLSTCLHTPRIHELLSIHHPAESAEQFVNVLFCVTQKSARIFHGWFLRNTKSK